MTDKNSTLWSKDSQFSVKDTANIVKIYMVDKNNQSVLFERTEKGWILNGNLKAYAAWYLFARLAGWNGN